MRATSFREYRARCGEESSSNRWSEARRSVLRRDLRPERQGARGPGLLPGPGGAACGQKVRIAWNPTALNSSQRLSGGTRVRDGAGAGKFWEMDDRMFANQTTFGRGTRAMGQGTRNGSRQISARAPEKKAGAAVTDDSSLDS